MIIADSHVHSQFSTDSHSPVENMIEAAIKKGFSRFYLTDHMDYDFPSSTHPFVFDPEPYYITLNSLKEKYQDQITILMGIELGLKPYLGPRYQTLLSQYPFDFVIGSTHLVDNVDPYLKEYWEGKTEREGLEHYFKGIHENITNTCVFDICGHLDYAVRYSPTKNQNFSFESYADYITEILIALIERGKGLEVNTSGFKYGLGHPHPQEDILKRYLELGGELLTIGSDAHKPEHIGYSFPETRELLKSIGFSYYTLFQNRVPQMFPL